MDYYKYFRNTESYHFEIAFVGYLPNFTLRMPYDPRVDKVLSMLFPCLHKKVLKTGDYISDWEYAKYLLRYAEPKIVFSSASLSVTDRFTTFTTDC